MKRKLKIKKNINGKFYYNENDYFHRLIGPAIELLDGDKTYYINGIYYIKFYKYNNTLLIYSGILKLNLEYEKYIKQNIKDLIKEYNPKIYLHYFLAKEQINQLPNFIKDLLIL